MRKQKLSALFWLQVGFSWEVSIWLVWVANGATGTTNALSACHMWLTKWVLAVLEAQF